LLAQQVILLEYPEGGVKVFYNPTLQEQ